MRRERLALRRRAAGRRPGASPWADRLGLGDTDVFGRWQESHRVPVWPLVTLGFVLVVVPRWSQFE